MLWRIGIASLATLLVLSSVATVLINQFRSNRVYHIGVLSTTGPELRAVRGVRDGLREHGYVEGDNLILTISPKGDYDSIRRLAADLVKSRVDVLVTVGRTETAIAKETTRNIAIVFAPASDPLGAGFIESFSRPGGNLTGIAYDVAPRGYTKQLEVFKEALPHLERIALIYDATTPARELMVAALRKTARHLKLKTTEFSVRTINEANRLALSFNRDAIEGVFTVCSNLFGRDKDTPAILRPKKIPMFACPSQVIDHGGLISYAPNGYDMGRRAAWYIDRMVKGAKPQDFPVEGPTSFELVINLKTADAIGVSIPPEVLQRADKVIR